LTKKGIIEAIDVPKPRPVIVTNVVSAPELTAEQALAWRTIEQSLVERSSSPILIHGVTGSGKTELYLRAVAWCLRHGRSAIILVPEIALASQVVRRFTARFPGRVEVLHSAMPDSQRYARWQAIAVGQHDVVVGPRSALFAPVCDFGLIVIDEEHEGAYKQESEPRYRARELAEQIARQQGAVLLLGSATPSVETYRRAETGEIGLLELKARVDPLSIARDENGQGSELELPEVEIVDMRLELHRGNASLFSERLTDLLIRTLRRREQAMLLLNRRGTSTVVICRSCGDIVKCPFCDAPMVFHQDRGRLLCHRCNHRQLPPKTCEVCGGQLDYFGAGTQRVEVEVKKLLPEARVMRWDQDSVRRHGGHDALLRKIEKQEVDIIVGTQMIAKGFDLPLVTATGVVHADTMLHLPDFRSGERTFQLLTQVAGRAGRRAPGGAVVVQSYTPEHYAIKAAANHDYQTFYAEEIDFRRMHGFPPFTRLVRYLYRHQDEAECTAESEDMARDLARHIKRSGAIADLLGPTPAFASRIRGKYQWQIVLRSSPDDMERLLDSLPARTGWCVDVDPQSML
jgi:primosomal protein N' (replication factor Y)